MFSYILNVIYVFLILIGWRMLVVATGSEAEQKDRKEFQNKYLLYKPRQFVLFLLAFAACNVVVLVVR